MKVKMLNEDDIERGDVICDNRNYCQKSLEFRAKLYVVGFTDTKMLICKGTKAVIYLHSSV